MEPEVMERESDDFEDTTGLAASCRDVVVLGAAHRLLSMVDPARLSSDSVEANMLDEKINVGSGGAVARNVYALFVQRREEERNRQLSERPVRAHFIK
jgi:hypothetical protein